MSNKSVTSTSQNESVKTKMSYSVGDIYMDKDRHHPCIFRIAKITKDRVSFDKWDYGDWDEGYHSETIQKFEEEFRDNYLSISIEEFFKEVNAILDGRVSINSYRDSQEISHDTSLVQVQSKEYLEVLRAEMEGKRKKAELLAAGVKIEMQRRQEELEKIRESMEVVVEEFREKVRQIEKVIYTIELYLGVREDIVQIQEGTSCMDTIHFWQQTLFMDEEVGDPLDGMQGLDYANIHVFDTWLLQYSNFYKKYNYELLIPQSKGLICLRVRRHTKDYGENRYENAIKNEENMKTYVLIRNGTNLYRIWGNIEIYPQLFPSQDDLQELKKKWDTLVDSEEQRDLKRIGNGEDIDDEDGDFDFSYENQKIQKEKKKINNTLFRYKQHLIFLQGLFDRTDIFHPIPEPISLMSSESHEKGLVKFVYDDDMRLTDGKPSFSDWQKSINESITEGSRIIYVKETYDRYSSHDIGNRFDKRYAHHYSSYNFPNIPQTGIYQVKIYKAEKTYDIKAVAHSIEEIPEYELKSHMGKDSFLYETGQRKLPSMEKLKKIVSIKFPYEYYVLDEKGYRIKEKGIVENLAIYYNPGDEVRNLWDYYDRGHTRQKNVSYKIFFDDKNILHYDRIDMEDVEYYLYDRRHRHEYRDMMPVLWSIKQLREKESAEELEFVKGLIQDMKAKNFKISNPKEAIWEAIEWFKLKNKWKRPLREDDALAWRMIRKRLGLNVK